MKWNPSRFFLTVVIALLPIGVLTILVYLSFGTLTTKDTGLLSIILTILSIIFAWVLSHLYSASSHAKAIDEVKSAHQENLQTYALKAAEKVTNLSDQLNKLSIYLEEELGNADYETAEESLRAKEERLHSAIHMIGMLKSINDTGLSDWEGVIGEQLEERREEREEREEELRDLVERMEKLWAANASADEAHSDIQVGRQLEILQKDVRALMAGVGGVSMTVHAPRKKIRRDLEKSCPICGGTVSYRQRAKGNSYKLVECASCKAKLMSKYSKPDDDFVLVKREEVPESINCPECGVEARFDLDNYPSSMTRLECDKCGAELRVTRTPNNRMKVVSRPVLRSELTEERIEEVRKLLPEQPWPKDTHKEIAEKLGYTNSIVSKAIAELIRRGVYKHQIDGVLYEFVQVSPKK